MPEACRHPPHPDFFCCTASCWACGNYGCAGAGHPIWQRSRQDEIGCDRKRWSKRSLSRHDTKINIMNIIVLTNVLADFFSKSEPVPSNRPQAGDSSLATAALPTTEENLGHKVGPIRNVTSSSRCHDLGHNVDPIRNVTPSHFRFLLFLNSFLTLLLFLNSFWSRFGP